MITTLEKVYKRVRQLWNDEYELNPGHRVIQSVQMTDDGKVEVELGDFQFTLYEENDQLIASLGLIPAVNPPSEAEMNAIIVHLAELIKNQTGDLPLKVINV